MWFGVAPTPAPSPRTNTKAWHPPHCTCAKHNSTASGGLSPRSSRKRPALDPHSSHVDTKATASPRTRNEVVSADPIVVEMVPSLVMPITQRGCEEVGAVIENRSLSGQQLCDDPPKWPSRRNSIRAMEATVHSLQTKEGIDRPEGDISHHQDERRGSRGYFGDLNARARSQQSRHRTGAKDVAELVKDSVAYPECHHTGNSALAGGLSVPAHEIARAPIRSRRGVRPRVPRHTEDDENNAGDPSFTQTLANKDPSGHVRLVPPMPERAHPSNLVGHTSSVGTVLVEETFVVTCSIDGSVKIWSQHSLQCLYTLYGHDDAASCADLSTRWLVSGSHDTTLRVYESAHGFRFLNSLRGHSGHVTRVSLIRNGDPELVLSGSDDMTLRLWDIESAQCIAVFVSHTSRLTCLLASCRLPTIFCSGSADATVCFWDFTPATSLSLSAQTQPKTPVRSFKVHRSTVQSLTLGMNQEVFSCSNDGSIHWFDAKSLQHLGCVDSVKTPMYSMVFHSGLLVCSTGDGRLLLYSGLSSRMTVERREMDVAPTWISTLHPFHGDLLACASGDDLYVIDIVRPRIDRIFNTAHGFLNCIQKLSSLKLVTCGEDNVVKVWSIVRTQSFPEAAGL